MSKGNFTGLIAIMIASVLVVLSSTPIYNALNPKETTRGLNQVYYEGSADDGDYNLTLSLSIEGNRIGDIKVKNGINDKNRKQIESLVAKSKGLYDIEDLKLENDPDKDLTELFKEAVKDSLGLKKKLGDEQGLFSVSSSSARALDDNIIREVDSVKSAIGTYHIQIFYPQENENYFGVQQYICYLRANSDDEITDCVFDYIPLNTAVSHKGIVMNGNASLISFKSDRAKETFDGSITDGSSIDLIKLAYTIKTYKTKNRIDDYFLRTNTATSPLAQAFYDAYRKLEFRGSRLDDFFAVATYAEVVMKDDADVGTYDAAREKNGRVLYNIYNCATNIDKDKKFTSVEISENRIGMEFDTKGEKTQNIRADLSSNEVAMNNLCIYAKGMGIGDFLTSVTHESDDLGFPILGSDLRKIVDVNIMNYTYIIGEAYYNTEKIDKKY